MERNCYSERLSAADAMREALLSNDLGRASAILNDEVRTIDWSGLHAAGADVAQAFSRYSATVLVALIDARFKADHAH